jgi:hypothetical protein
MFNMDRILQLDSGLEWWTGARYKTANNIPYFVIPIGTWLFRVDADRPQRSSEIAGLDAGLPHNNHALGLRAYNATRSAWFGDSKTAASERDILLQSSGTPSLKAFQVVRDIPIIALHLCPDVAWLENKMSASTSTRPGRWTDGEVIGALCRMELESDIATGRSMAQGYASTEYTRMDGVTVTPGVFVQNPHKYLSLVHQSACPSAVPEPKHSGPCNIA